MSHFKKHYTAYLSISICFSVGIHICSIRVLIPPQYYGKKRMITQAMDTFFAPSGSLATRNEIILDSFEGVASKTQRE